MKIDNVSFPYPVLGISDDISPALPQNNAVVSYDEVQPGIFEFSVVLNFDNEDIKRYILEGYAEYSVEVNCRSTLFRQCFKSDTSCIKFPIDKYRLHNKVTFECFVIVKKDISEYVNAGLHPDYTGHTIRLHPGDLMVAFTPQGIDANVNLNNLRNPTSFMRFRRDKNETLVSYSLDNKIIVNLPDDEYSVFQNLSKEEKKRVCAPVYLDALTYALFNFRKHKDDDQCLWVQAIKYRLRDDDIISQDFSMESIAPEDGEELDANEVIMLAQAMLRNPFKNTFEQAAENNNQERVKIG